jgi:D-alanine-D-alanine ligase-like ATP-grasp enzyme
MSGPLKGRHVAVLLGGLSSEREVSLVSGRECADAWSAWAPRSAGSTPAATSPRC